MGDAVVLKNVQSMRITCSERRRARENGICSMRIAKRKRAERIGIEGSNMC